MAQPATLLRFKIELSDIDRGIYESLDFRIAQHPSETSIYLLTRIIAYALNRIEGLEFSALGLSDPDSPALRLMGENGQTELWIEIGNPSAKKLHKASKAAKLVKVYTYKDPQVLVRELESQHVHRLSEIEIYAISPKFLESLEKQLARDNKWSFVLQENLLTVHTQAGPEQCEIQRHR